MRAAVAAMRSLEAPHVCRGANLYAQFMSECLV